ncbi:MAG: serine hydroxymethyltransferase [Planctomycetota bacterium]
MNAPDTPIADILRKEEERQTGEINLIASENIVSEAVLKAAGSVLTNKYAEGYPGRRWYHGCTVVDEAEALAQTRACALFGASYANVQPHSGSTANMAAYFATVPRGSKVLAMDLSHGGHLTHGSSANFSGRLYEIIPYGVSKDSERIDMNEVRRIAREQKPAMILAGASAYARTLDFAEFRSIADEVGAKLFVDMAHIAGLVAGGVHPSPLPHADIVSTTTHKTLRGPRGGLLLCGREKGADAALGKKVDSHIFPGIQGGPLMHIIAAKAVALHEASQPSFKDYAARVVAHAQRLSGYLAERGFRIVSGGTDNHLFMMDVTPRGFSGAQAAERLQTAGIVVNKNSIPFDQRKITETSGIRIGAQLVTSRGFGPKEFDLLGEWIDKALDAKTSEADLKALRAKTRELASAFPIYPVA